MLAYHDRRDETRNVGLGPAHDWSSRTGSFPKPAMISIQPGSGEIVVDPSLKSDRDRGRRLTALQGQVAAADQTAHLAVANPNRQAPQPHPGPCAVRLHPLGGR